MLMVILRVIIIVSYDFRQPLATTTSGSEAVRIEAWCWRRLERKSREGGEL